MNYWIFIASNHRLENGVLTAEEVFRQRTQDQFWGLGERTSYRRTLQKGDAVVFYLGTPFKCFAGTASLRTECFSLRPDEKEKFAHGSTFYRTDYGVLLENVAVWQQRKPIENLVAVLDFIENKEFWGTYLQGGVRQLTESDFRKITLEIPDAPSDIAVRTQIALEASAEFALESHLEEFLDKNWDLVNFGAVLERYQLGDQSGRQFPAGPWSIDFLCRDKSTDEFVIVELKRGKTSDTVVGQISRYMGWVRENLAKPGQNVRGIIIAKEVDDALRFSSKALPGLSVFTYHVDFSISKAS